LLGIVDFVIVEFAVLRIHRQMSHSTVENITP